MRFQSNQSSCGPAALRNALLCHGIIRSEDELAALSGMTPEDGTSARGLAKALAAVAKEHPRIVNTSISESRDDVALLKVYFSIQQGHPVILCVDQMEHWVTAFGIMGSNVFHVADSADNEMVKHYSSGELLARWRGVTRKPYFGIVV